jgi:hypothetical protein
MLKVPDIFLCCACREIKAQGGGLILPAMLAFACTKCILAGRATLVSEGEITNKRLTPWSDSQVSSLSAYQDSSKYFPFVCDESHVYSIQRDGLFCQKCNQKQIWSYDWTLDWTWVDPPDSGGSLVPRKPRPTPKRPLESFRDVQDEL